MLDFGRTKENGIRPAARLETRAGNPENRMSLLTKLKSNAPRIYDRPNNLTHLALDKVERYGAAAGFGYLKGYYREKAGLRLGEYFVPYDGAVGVLATFAAVGLQMWTNGRSSLAPHLNALGDAGVMSYLNSRGAAWGGKASGHRVFVLAPGAKTGALPPGMSEVVGQIPQAGVGAFLNSDAISQFSKQR